MRASNGRRGNFYRCILSACDALLVQIKEINNGRDLPTVDCRLDVCCCIAIGIGGATKIDYNANKYKIRIADVIMCVCACVHRMNKMFTVTSLNQSGPTGPLSYFNTIQNACSSAVSFTACTDNCNIFFHKCLLLVPIICAPPLQQPYIDYHFRRSTSILCVLVWVHCSSWRFHHFN